MSVEASIRSHPSLARLLGISLAYFMVLLDTTVLAVAEPALMTSLHTGVVGVGWATAIYTSALASALVLGGVLADRLGAYRVFLTGVLGFGAASLACALAVNLPMLLGARAVLGLCAAAIVPSSLSIIAALYHDRAQRTRAIGAWAAISGAAMAAGPVIGGWLVAVASWRAVFVVNVPIAIAVALLCRTPIETPRSTRPISWAPHLLLAATLVAATLAIIEAGEGAETPALAAALAALGLGGVLAVVDRRSRAPIVPASLRADRAVWMTFGWGAAINYALTTIVFAVPLLLDAPPAVVGAMLLPMTLMIAVNPLLTARLVVAVGALRPIRWGFAALPAGLAVIAVALVIGGRPVVLGLGLLLCGLGISWTLPALVGHAVAHAAPDATGSVGGLLNASRQIGATIAAAVTSAVLAQHPEGAVVIVPFVIAGVVCIVGLIGALRSRPGRADDRQ